MEQTFLKRKIFSGELRFGKRRAVRGVVKENFSFVRRKMQAYFEKI